MTAVKWHEGHMVALDTETTGTDPLEARIVTAAIVHFAPGQRPSTIEWVIDPGVDVPDEAAAVHGWTNERIAAHIGRPGQGRLAVRLHKGRKQVLTADAAVFEIAAQCATAMGADAPLVIHNAAYDVTVLEQECRRYDVPTLTSRPTGIRGLVDLRVVEKQHDLYRKVCYKAPGCSPSDDHHECGGCRGQAKHKCGGCGATNRKLINLCRHYGVPHAGAHDASADAVAAVRVLKVVASEWADIARLRLATLHEHQVTWKREQSDGLRDFWTRTGNPAAAEVDSGWPLHSKLTPALTGARA